MAIGMDLSNRFQSITLAVSVFLLFGLLDGIRMSFGVLLLDWTSNFGAGRAEVGWVGAIVYGVSNLSGSLSSFVIRRTSCHVTIAVGSGMVAAGLFLSSFAVNITYLYFSYGILIGGHSVLTPVVLTDISSAEEFPDTIGYLWTTTGIGTMIGTPIAGLLFDVNRNYDVAFAVSGGVIAVSGLVAASLLCIKGRAQNRDLQVDTPDKQ